MINDFKPNVLLCTYYDRKIIAEQIERLRDFAKVIDCGRGRCLTKEEVFEVILGSHAIIAADEKYDTEVLDRAKDLLIIARDGTGYDSIDLKAATDRGILVTRAPVVHHCTANMVIGLMIALVRKIVLCDRGVRQNLWTDRQRWLCPDLSGMTLGILGFGQVGKEVAKRALAMDMKILVYNRSNISDAVRQFGVKISSLDEVLANSDVISVHIRHSKETMNMFNSKMFAKMKKGSYFLNASRGGIVDEKALIEALASGHLAGAGLDVFAQEPTLPDNPLLNFDNVLCTPHVAGDTSTTMVKAIEMNLNQIADCLTGKKPDNLLNPEVWEKARIHNIK